MNRPGVNQAVNQAVNHLRALQFLLQH
eukprot:COSAG04_NODE_8834_length_926_cov_1.291415_1_plen_26_part_10